MKEKFIIPATTKVSFTYEKEIFEEFLFFLIAEISKAIGIIYATTAQITASMTTATTSTKKK